jgi:glucose-6-phosphate isomerase
MDSLQRLIELDAVARLRAHDATLFADDAAGRDLAAASFGWISPEVGATPVLQQLERLAREAAEEPVTDVVLLGMGGSSLASLVIADVFASSAVKLHVLDTTAPLSVARVVGTLDPARTLYVVASKSGSTIEPLSLYAIFREEADNELGALEAGKRFVAITDPDTSLESLAATGGFRALVSSPADVGGRFSALTVFGLVTAALLGVDVEKLVERGTAMSAACAMPAAENPAAKLAAFAADALVAGRDKLTVVSSGTLATFGLWVEQLVAESLGKEGTGIVPVVELSGEYPAGYGPDRAVVIVRTKDDQRLASWVARLGETSPVFEVVLRDEYDLAAEFVRWEHAIALLGPLLGVNPFGQPNVAAAKAATAAVLAGELQVPQPQFTLTDGTTLTYAGGLESPTEAPETLHAALVGVLGVLRPRDFLGVLAYLPADATLLAPLGAATVDVTAATGVAVTLEIGPRYLHSTGQLHKGGANVGVFVLVTTRDHADVPVPGQPWGLGQLHRAQAEGDLTTLISAGRRVLRVDLCDAGAETVAAFATALSEAASR